MRNHNVTVNNYYKNEKLYILNKTIITKMKRYNCLNVLYHVLDILKLNEEMRNYCILKTHSIKHPIQEIILKPILKIIENNKINVNKLLTM